MLRASPSQLTNLSPNLAALAATNSASFASAFRGS